MLSALLFVASPSARADDEACFRAAVEGQKLQKRGKLVEARARFVACAQRSCDAPTVVDKCTGWLQQVEGALPSLTIAVKDGEGRDVPMKRARVDGADASAALTGRAIDVDPGTHSVVVEVGDATLSESVLVRQGEKNRAVVFRAPAPKERPTRAPLYGALVATGVGAAGAATFAYFGARGLSDRARFGCAAGCPAEHYRTVHQELLAADIALGITAGALAVATVLFVISPRAPGRTGLRWPRPDLVFTF